MGSACWAAPAEDEEAEELDVLDSAVVCAAALPESTAHSIKQIRGQGAGTIVSLARIVPAAGASPRLRYAA